MLAGCGGAGGAAKKADVGETAYDSGPLNVRALDDDTLQVVLNAPTPYFLYLTAFTTYYPVDKNVVEPNPEGWTLDPATFVSNGYFTVTEFSPSQRIVMEKNKNYWDKDNVLPNKITFNLIEDSNAIWNGYEAKSIDVAENVPVDVVKQHIANNDPQLHLVDGLGVNYVTFNTADENNPALKDPKVRQALTLAIDSQYLIDNIIGYGTPAAGIVPFGIVDADGGDFREEGGNYFDPLAVEANLEKAKALLAEAGYPDGIGADGKQLSFGYLTNPSSSNQLMAEALQSMWSKLGVQANIEQQEWATMLVSRQNGEFDTARGAWVMDFPDPVNMLDLFVTGNGNNDAQYSNPQFDALVDSAKKETDPAARMQMLHDAEDILFAEWVAAPINFRQESYFADPAITGIFKNIFSMNEFSKSSKDDLQIAIGPQPQTMDPAINSAADVASMLLNCFDGLTRITETGETVPALAESYDVSEDGLTYTFHLRKNLKWSDGTKLTANDFVYSWNRAVSPEAASPYEYMFSCVDGYPNA
jgi:oligopeptide transport system substrate-binding protein